MSSRLFVDASQVGFQVPTTLPGMERNCSSDQRKLWFVSQPRLQVYRILPITSSAKMFALVRQRGPVALVRVAQARTGYTATVIEHYENPKNVGALDKSKTTVGTGLVGAPACGES
jgi:hypothetical protein